MAMQLQTEAAGGCLLARISGEFEMGESLAIQRRAFEAARQARLAALLFDVRGLGGVPGVMHRYKLALSIVEESNKLTRDLGQKVRVAFVGEDPVIARDHFGEDVAVNRGANMRVFTGQNEARAWLLAP
jgi:hypothetical protein